MNVSGEHENDVFKAGAIDRVHKQLMAVAVAVTTQCRDCIEGHLIAARKEGATEQMLHEAVQVAAGVRRRCSIDTRNAIQGEERR